MTATDMIRDYMNNHEITVNELDQVRLESTGQTLGQILTSEEGVRHHLRTLTEDNGNAWYGIETAGLYTDPISLNPGLRYLGENSDGVPVWYQGY